MSRDAGVLRRYTDGAPFDAWTQPDYDDSAWKESEGVFAHHATCRFNGITLFDRSNKDDY